MDGLELKEALLNYLRENKKLFTTNEIQQVVDVADILDSIHYGAKREW